jgi:hypothetical protein
MDSGSRSVREKRVNVRESCPASGTASPIVLLAAALGCAACALLSGACARTSNRDGGAPERFSYEGRTYELDGYHTLFDSSSPLGQARAALFTKYLADSNEGRARREAAGSNDPAIVWGKLAVEEKSAFVAITAALACVAVDNGVSRFINWIGSLDEIHGDERFGGGPLSNSEAFRLYVRLTGTGLDLLRREAGAFHNTCIGEGYDYGGLGSTHGDFCDVPLQFDSSAKFDDSQGPRGIQFNFNDERSDCADIDVDYSVACHVTRGNSNVLDDCLGAKANHINRLVAEYGTGSGLRLILDREATP